MGQAGHGPSQWERARAPCSLHGAVAGAALSDSHPPGVHGRQAVQPRRGLHAQGAKLLHGVPPPAPAQLRPRARLPTCPAGSPFAHCHAQMVPRPAASDLLCSKGACRPLAASARAAVCPELSPCCPTCRTPCCPGPRRKQDTCPSTGSASRPFLLLPWDSPRTHSHANMRPRPLRWEEVSQLGAPCPQLRAAGGPQAPWNVAHGSKYLQKRPLSERNT